MSDDVGHMDPARQAFFTAVLRYLAIRFDTDRPNSSEYRSLLDFLSEPLLGSLRPPWQQRSFRRIDLDGMPGTIHVGPQVIPFEVVDISATGMRVRAQHRAPFVNGKGRSIVRMQPRQSTLHIELAVECVHQNSEPSECGLSFVGAPVLLHRHATLKRRSASRAANDAKGYFHSFAA